MPNGVWLLLVGSVAEGGMFLFQWTARAAKPGCWFALWDWMNLSHTVALSHSITQITHCRSEVGNTPFTGFVMIYKPLRKPIKIFIAVSDSKELLLLIYSITKARQFLPLHCKCINPESHTREKWHWNGHTCKPEEERPRAGMLGLKVSGEANNCLELLQKLRKQVCGPWSRAFGSSVSIGVLWYNWPEATKWLSFPLNLVENKHFRKQNC